MKGVVLQVTIDADYYEVEVALLQYNEVFVFKKPHPTDVIRSSREEMFCVLMTIWTSYRYDGVRKGICIGGDVVPKEGWLILEFYKAVSLSGVVCTLWGVRLGKQSVLT